MNHLIELLKIKGFKISEETSRKATYVHTNHSVIILDQGVDGNEVWIKKDDGDWVRLDFILEYFLTGSVDLKRKSQSKLKSEENNGLYYAEFINQHYKELFENGKPSILEYPAWLRNNSGKIRMIRDLLNP